MHRFGTIGQAAGGALYLSVFVCVSCVIVCVIHKNSCAHKRTRHTVYHVYGCVCLCVCVCVCVCLFICANLCARLCFYFVFVSVFDLPSVCMCVCVLWFTCVFFRQVQVTSATHLAFYLAEGELLACRYFKILKIKKLY